MKTERTITQSIAAVALVTGIILLIPLVLQLTIGTGVDGQGFNWKPGDFLFAGVLIFGTGLTYKLVTRKSGDVIYRVAIGFALATGFFLIWANMAVGIIGSEDNPVNLLYFLVLFVGIIGAFISRFRPHGLSLTMFAMALAQAIVAATALAGGFYQSSPSSVFQILIVNGLFITLFVVSAMLFKYAVQEKTKPGQETTTVT